MRRSSLLFTLLSLLLSPSSPLVAQWATVTGTVTDAKSEELLIGVNVFNQDQKGSTTNLAGEYSLQLPAGEHELTFSSMGYKEHKEQIVLEEGEKLVLDVGLKFSSRQLNMLVITGSQYEKNVARETITTEVLSQDLIRNTNSKDLNEALSRTPGVIIQDGQISIRGGSSYSYGVGSRTGVLVDGISVIDADFGEAQLKLAPIENAQQVEVVKGASSVVYGASALNGVVNVRTLWPTSEKGSNQLRVYSQIFGRPANENLIWWEARQPNSTGLFYSYARKIGQLQVVGGGHLDVVQSFLEEADEYRFRANLKTRYLNPRIEGLSYGLNFNIMKETSGRFFLAEDLKDNFYNIPEGSEDRYVKTYVDPHLTFNRNGHKYSLNARYMNIFRRGNGDDINASSNIIRMDNQYQRNFNELVVLTLGLPVEYGFSKHNLYQGYDTIFDANGDVVDTVTVPVWRQNYNIAGYAQVEYNPNRLSLTAGVRYELQSIDTVFESSRPVFRTGLNYQAGKATFLRASFGQAYRLPSIAERFVADNIVDGVYLIPNPLLEPEIGWSAEVGIKQGLKIRNWNAFIDLSVYWQEYDEFVEYVFGLYENTDEFGNQIFNQEPDGTPLEPDDLLFGAKPFNVENARIAGYEFSVVGQGNIGPVGLNTLLGYTYNWPANLEEAPDQKDVGNYLSNAWKYATNRVEDPEEVSQLLQFRTRHIIRGDIELSYGRFSAGFSLFYNSFPERIPQAFNLAFAVIADPSSLPEYAKEHENGDWTYEVRTSVQLSDRIKAGFIIKNITNLIYSQRPGKPEPPRSFTVTLNFDLGKQ